MTDIFPRCYLSLLFFHSDCGFDHNTFSDAKFHGEADDIYCRAIGASVLELWIITVCVYKGI